MKALLCASALLAATCGAASAQAINNIPLPPIVPDGAATAITNALGVAQQQAANGLAQQQAAVALSQPQAEAAVSLAQQQAANSAQAAQSLTPGNVAPAQPTYLPLIQPFLQ